MIILGILCITIGVILWLSAVLVTKIDRKIKEGKLITTGIYSIVRNPIYSAFLFIFTGIIFLVNNIYLFISITNNFLDLFNYSFKINRRKMVER